MEKENDVLSADEPQPDRRGKHRGDLLDRTWDFFASVPVATVLIFIIAVASIAGSLIDQEGQYSDWRPPADYYPSRYGPTLGNLFLRTGLTRMYTSWWFLTLLFMLGISLVICSLERFVPLWRNVQRPDPVPPPEYVTHLKQRFEYAPNGAAPLETLAAMLRRRGYHVVQQEGRLYADKGRWGRWGPYVTHIGLLFILAAALMRAIPGFYMDDTIWVRDGATAKVPGTDWFIRNDKFTAEFYASGQPKSYSTSAVVIDGGREVAHATIAVNAPLQYKSTQLYQQNFQQELGKAQITLSERATGKALGSFELDLLNPAESYTAGGYKLAIQKYLPDFGVDDQGKPISRSSTVSNPALLLQVTPPDGGTPYTTWYFVLYPDVDANTSTPFKLTTTGGEVSSTSGLRVKKDLGLPLMYVGLLVVSLGVFATFYLAHRRYWALPAGDRMIVGGWTNRNQGGLAGEMTLLANALNPEASPKPDTREEEER